MVVSCALCVFLIITVCFGIYFSGKYYFPKNEHYIQVFVNPKEILFETDEKFLSVALDTSFMRFYFHNFTDGDWKKLEEYSKLLSPGFFRVGGTDADRAVFHFYGGNSTVDFSNTTCKDYPSNNSIIISGKDLVKLNTFAKNSNLSMIFTLNVLLRNGTHWDGTNAESLLNFSNSRNLNMDFELGNEPNSFPHVFNEIITGGQLAEDFERLKTLLDTSSPESKLIGPDVTRPRNLLEPSLKYLDEFLSKGNSVDAVSWHYYYLNGHTATLDDFVDISTFRLLRPAVESITTTVRKYSKDKPIWIGETGSAFGGGAPGLSDRFVASFLWVDLLGSAPRSNISVVIRQALFQGHYALIGDDLIPNPDFWISVLYKNLVSNKVLDVNVRKSDHSDVIRFYGHCLASNSPLNGSVVIFGMNIGKEEKALIPVTISIVYPVHAFIFQPKFNLTSREVFLNSRSMDNVTSFDDMVQMAEEVKLPLIIPPYSIGFWILNEVNSTACKR